jgi:hypothetical protein
VVEGGPGVHFNSGDSSIAFQFIKSVPQFWLSDFGPQKLAFVFQSLADFLNKIPDSSLLCSSRLFEQDIPFAVESGFATLSSIGSTRSESESIKQGVSFFEGSLGISFADNVRDTLAVSLTRVLQETETHQTALRLLHVCLGNISRAEQTIFLSLPLVTFDLTDLQ